jgi:energy-coupling factor transporter ATP-binding protein EcfA2
MNSEISKISKVEIESLWNRFDLTWNLHPDVNILSGINGSGKSTILNYIAGLLLGTIPDNYLTGLFKSVKVTLDNGECLSLEHISSGSLSEIKTKIGNNKVVPFYHSEDNSILGLFVGERTLGELRSLIKVDIISTFDKEILEVGKRPDENVRTELDRDIFRLQKQYLDYQLNIGKRAFEIVTQNNGHLHEELLKIRKQQDRFLEIMDNLFKDTDKKINRNNNEITFLSGNNEITAYQLSSGEKQMLVILLTVLVQDNKPAIIFMDEPEISLHFDWQKKLIQYIRELNPNIQIILATHSPAIIMEGWHDKVANVSDLIVKDSLKSGK